MSTEKKQIIKVGNGKKRKDNWITASVCIDKLTPHQYEYNGKFYVNLNINIKHEPDQYGKDVELSINEYKPNNIQINNNNNQSSKVTMQTYVVTKNNDDDLPF